MGNTIEKKKGLTPLMNDRFISDRVRTYVRTWRTSANIASFARGYLISLNTAESLRLEDLSDAQFATIRRARARLYPLGGLTMPGHVTTARRIVHVVTTSSYNILDVSRFRYLRFPGDYR